MPEKKLTLPLLFVRIVAISWALPFFTVVGFVLVAGGPQPYRLSFLILTAVTCAVASTAGSAVATRHTGAIQNMATLVASVTASFVGLAVLSSLRSLPAESLVYRLVNPVLILLGPVLFAMMLPYFALALLSLFAYIPLSVAGQVALPFLPGPSSTWLQKTLATALAILGFVLLVLAPLPLPAGDTLITVVLFTSSCTLPASLAAAYVRTRFVLSQK